MIGNRGLGGGSGVYLGDGLVLTCSHLFRDDRGQPDVGRVVVSFVGGEASEATLIAEDTVWDMALLRLAKAPDGVAEASLSVDPPTTGQTVAACGYGGSGLVRRSVGRITGFGRDSGSQTADNDTLIVSGSVRQGDSGGPIFDQQGRIVAVLWGSNRTTVVGTRAARCLRFLAKFRRPCPKPTEAAPEAVQSVTRSHECAAEFAQLRADVDGLQRQMAALGDVAGIPGPAGKDGVDGQDGRDGLDGTSPSVEDIIARVNEGVRIPSSFTLTPNR